MGLFEKTLESIEGKDAAWLDQARVRLENLTMPPWALGRLMDLAEELAAMTRSMRPPLARKAVVTMAADHGVTAAGVSAFPQKVTRQMVCNFVNGGAGINALTRSVGAEVKVVDMGVACDLSELKGKIIDKRIAAGTNDISRGPAMTREQAHRAVEAGIELAFEMGSKVDVFGTGEMGIGNTTPSAAIAAVLSDLPAAEVTGRGTGVDEEGWQNKVTVIERAIAINRPNPNDGFDVLRKVGGFEIGGLAGLIIGAAAQKKPVLLDGFISTAAGLIAHSLAPKSADYMISAHRSAENGHQAMLNILGKESLLDLGLRLGEGTGAALAMPLLDSAASLLTEVATFEEAAVTGEQN